jgi:hypothetical protein
VDDAEKSERIERRRRVVALIRAMQAKDDAQVDSLIATLVADTDHTRVIGALAVAGSTLADSAAKAAGRPTDEVLDELETGLTSAPVE